MAVSCSTCHGARYRCIAMGRWGCECDKGEPCPGCGGSGIDAEASVANAEARIRELEEELRQIKADLWEGRQDIQSILSAAKDHYGDTEAYVHLERLLEAAQESDAN